MPVALAPVAMPEIGAPLLLGSDDANDIQLPLSHYVWLVKTHWIKMVAFIAFAVIATAMVTARLTPLYEAKASLYLDRNAAKNLVGQDSQSGSANKGDSDHVVALFKRDGCWGAISKTNHIWLRWRDPVYRTPRELAMSYFHEYVDTRQRKSLRTYSMPIDLRRFAPETWITNDEDCWDVGAALCDVRHFKLLTPAQVRALAPRDATETLADDMVQYEYKDRTRARRY